LTSPNTIDDTGSLFPNVSPIVLARKPLSEGTVAANVLRWGTGALNIDGCRVEGMPQPTRFDPKKHGHDGYRMTATGAECAERAKTVDGRWPANVVHDGSDEVVEAFPSPHGAGKARSGKFGGEYDATSYDMGKGGAREMGRFGDSGSAARFFYSAKASRQDRAGSKHPTVKPIALMEWLCRLVTPPGGHILDPFAGSGTTGQAAINEGFLISLIELETEYQQDIQRRMENLDCNILEFE
jgi:site-specific DNA-methyltransferase (adenine-specific)